ncbi:ribonucleotide reductase inhibitor-domain-containing protein [Jackrogersella minutella]|nr:ribonucleotide reductase inhibitor-domain-containing protein [Jackrogersella minutella]
MSAPRTKRQFAGAASDPAQRQITSFFSSALPSSSTSPQHLAVPPITTSPLPASVQSNLLSVGMRVRKSVPEGYKTGSYSAFTLWDENDNTTTSTANTTMGEGRSRANAISTPRELLPFCGIHNVGGLGAQPASSASTSYQPLLSVNGLPLEDSMNDEDDVPGLTSSQETVDSTASAPPKTRKRSYTEEDEDERPTTPGRLSVDFDFAVWRDGFDGEVSPRSQVPPAGTWAPSNGRLMAIPRKPRRHRGAKAARLDQENVMVVDAEGAGAGDFGEADFLVRTADWEVEMSDV